ncbi:type IV pili methyl-accepting chemotaxis transducer N-terminal domain-containing protein [Aliagarivorans marinus]|uniref:type IV pili methyl-accepting chemotaxis transducer N-terminal domain-containing protein n=1 Tax=Aliagarivorans marinus TaxID=561965 RepID=UPI000404EB2C|nr:type IV pili methyl-accepting chemotaxis transducer N-terminal domain-containing protein [Aliagarivorans marinus]
MKGFSSRRSLGTTVITLLSTMILIFVVVSLVSLTSLRNSLNDAEAINIAGSLRMQSYRLAYLQVTDNQERFAKLAEFERSLASPALVFVTKQNDELEQLFAGVLDNWRQMKPYIETDDPYYPQHVARFVNRIDHFVNRTEYYSELKVQRLSQWQLAGLITSSLMALLTLAYLRFRVVLPLYQLESSAQQIQEGNFHIAAPSGKGSAELERLSAALVDMAKQLDVSYQSLERQVEAKTRALSQANADLSFLYQQEQLLFNNQLDEKLLQHSLGLLSENLGISHASLTIDALGITVNLGDESQIYNYQQTLTSNDQAFGQLRLQSVPIGREDIVASYQRTISKVVRYEQGLLQRQKLLLMEERAIIARELHDSLAQTLSYLKIQTSLLQRSLSDPAIAEVNPPAGYASEIHQVINDAYVQLRELLNTFRLTIKDASLADSLSALVKEMGQQTEVTIKLNSKLGNDLVPAHQQVHIIQICREAIVNAIKHANCDSIELSCVDYPTKLLVRVSDNGQSGQKLQQQSEHYGLQIMQERAERLGGQLEFGSSPSGGVIVTLELPREPATTGKVNESSIEYSGH